MQEQAKLVRIDDQKYAVHFEGKHIGYVGKLGATWQGIRADGDSVSWLSKTRKAMVEALVNLRNEPPNFSNSITATFLHSKKE
jgi:hypothetical protein